MEPAFPGNSQRARAEKVQPPQREKLKPIVTTSVIQRKKPLSKRVMETFVGGDARGTMMFVVGDILVPAAKDMLAEALTQGFERMIFGESRNSGRRSSFSAPRNYNRMSHNRPPMREDPRELSRRARVNHEFDEIILDTRAEAELVIDKLDEQLAEYDVVTVATLYDLVGISSQHTDGKWGWDSMEGARVEKLRGGGYLLNLPKTQPVD